MNQIPKNSKSKALIHPIVQRTYLFAQNTRAFLRCCKHDFISLEDAKQLTRSSGSVGANYIEANKSLSKKDFRYRIKICRKEVKESIYWLKLLPLQQQYEQQKFQLIDEATQLLKIFSSIN